jgi:hypothetical protein
MFFDEVQVDIIYDKVSFIRIKTALKNEFLNGKVLRIRTALHRIKIQATKTAS